jgi:hypothetical protein
VMLTVEKIGDPNRKKNRQGSQVACAWSQTKSFSHKKAASDIARP